MGTRIKIKQEAEGNMEIKRRFCFAPRLFASLFFSSAHCYLKKKINAKVGFGPKFATRKVLIEDINSCPVHTGSHNRTN